jgi:RNA polymerase sigma factor (sigma-70 family)
MKEYSAQEIIKGISGRKSRVIHYVYKSCFPDVRKLILTNGGNEHDAQDIFQEGLLKVYLKITGKGLELNCKFKTYLYSVCRFLWLNELEKKKVRQHDRIPPDEIIDDRTANDRIRENAGLKLYERHFRELGKECQKVLNMHFRRASLEQICVAMGYKSTAVAANKKHQCKKSLMEKIYNNPDFRKLSDEIHLAG